MAFRRRWRRTDPPLLMEWPSSVDSGRRYDRTYQQKVQVAGFDAEGAVAGLAVEDIATPAASWRNEEDTDHACS